MKDKRYGLLFILLLLMPMALANNTILANELQKNTIENASKNTIIPFKPIPNFVLNGKTKALVSEPETLTRQPYIGPPSDWWDVQFEYRINVTVTEPGISDMDNWFVDVFVTFDPPAYKYSIRVVKVTDTGFQEVPYQVWNVSMVNEDYINSATVTILVSVEKGGTAKYQIYWSTEQRNPPSISKKVAVDEYPEEGGVKYVVKSIDYGWSIELPPANGGKPSNITLPTGEKIGADWLHFGATRGVSTNYGGYWGTGNTNYEPEARYIAELRNDIEKFYAGAIFVTYKIINAPLKDGDQILAYVNYTYRIFSWGIIVEEKVKWVNSDSNVDYYIAGWVFDQDDGDLETFNTVVTDKGIFDFPNGFVATISNLNSFDVYDYQVRIDLSDLISEPIPLKVIDTDGNSLDFCYEHDGVYNTTPSTVIWVKIPYIPANGKVKIIILQSDINGAADPSEVFDFYGKAFEKHVLYNTHHNPYTRDIYDYYWGDAGRDAFDGYGYTYLDSESVYSSYDVQLIIRPPENGGTSPYEVTLSDGAKFIVYKDMLLNQNGYYCVLRIVLLPANEEALTDYFSVYRRGNLGSDSSTYINYYSFTYNDKTYRYIMTWDWSADVGYGDPNIWYFMTSLYDNYDPTKYHYTRSGDNLYEYLDYAKGLTLLYLSPSDNPLGDSYIASLLTQEMDYFSNFKDCVWNVTADGRLLARKYYTGVIVEDVRRGCAEFTDETDTFNEYVALIHSEMYRAIGFIHLSWDLLQGSIEYTSPASFIWYNEGNDSDIDYIYFAKYLQISQVGAGTTVRERYVIVPWMPSGDTIDERTEFFFKIKNETSSTLDVSLGDYEAFYYSLEINVTDGDGLPISGAIVEFYNSTDDLVYADVTDENGILLVDVIRDYWNITVEVPSGNLTYVSSTIIDLSGTSYTDYGDEINFDFSNLIKVSLRALTNTSDHMPIQNGKFTLTNGNIAIVSYTNYTGWTVLYLTKEQWYIEFNATSTSTPDPEDYIYVFADEALSNFVGEGSQVLIDFGTSSYRMLWVIDDDIRDNPIPTQLALWDTENYIQTRWGETIEIKVNLTRTDYNEPIDGTLHWYIFDTEGNCVLNGTEDQVYLGTFIFDLDLSLLEGGKTYTMLINATPIIPTATKPILYPVPITITLDVLNRIMLVQVNYMPSDLTIYWGEELIVQTDLYDYDTGSPVTDANVTAVVYYYQGRLEIPLHYKTGATYEAELGEYLKQLEPGTYTMHIEISKDNYELLFDVEPVQIKILPRPTQLAVYDEEFHKVYEYLEVPWKPNVTLYIEYLDVTGGTGTPITDGNVSWLLLNPANGTIISEGDATLSGNLYVIMLDVSSLPEGNYKLNIIASSNVTAEVRYEISFVLRHHRVSVETDKKQIVVYHDEEISIKIKYYDLDLGSYIVGANATYTIQSLVNPLYKLSGELIDLKDGTYLLKINTSQLYYLGGYLISVSFSKVHYDSANILISAQVVEIPTVLYIYPSKNVTVLWGENVTFLINYTDYRTGKPIADAEFRISINDTSTGENISLPESAYSFGYENGYYYISLDTKYFNASQSYLINVFISKAYYKSYFEILHLTIKKPEITVDVQTNTNITKNLITSSAESEVKIIVTESTTGLQIIDAKIYVIVEMAGKKYTDVLAKKVYVGVFIAKIDWTLAEPDAWYTIKIVVKEVVLPNLPPIPAEYLEYSGDTEIHVHVDYPGGTMKIGNFKGPRVILLPSFVAILTLIGVFGYRIYSWYRLPVEVRELIILMRNIEKGIYEYTAPTRADVFKEMALEALRKKKT